MCNAAIIFKRAVAEHWKRRFRLVPGYHPYDMVCRVRGYSYCCAGDESRQPLAIANRGEGLRIMPSFFREGEGRQGAVRPCWRIRLQA